MFAHVGPTNGRALGIAPDLPNNPTTGRVYIGRPASRVTKSVHVGPTAGRASGRSTQGNFNAKAESDHTLSPAALARAACRLSKVQNSAAPSTSAAATCRISRLRVPSLSE